MTTQNQFLRLQKIHLPDSARLAALVDVETTGLDCARDRIVEFAGVLFAFDPESGMVLAIIDEYTWLNDSGMPKPSKAADVHGIHERTMKGHRLDPERIDRLLSDAEFVVAHNAKFDFDFVALVSPVARSKPWRCSINGVSWASEGHDPAKLQGLLESHCVYPEAAYRALNHVLCTLELLNRPDSSGQPYLKQLVNSRPEEFTHTESISQKREVAKRPGATHPQTDGPTRSSSGAICRWVAISLGGLALLMLTASLLG